MVARRASCWGALLLVANACTPWQSYSPRLAQPGELTLRQGRRLEIYAHQRRLTRGPAFAELEDYVSCVPVARRHARRARRAGRASRGLRWTGGGMGVVSLGGLSGVSIMDENRDLGWALLGAGLSTAVLGVIVSGSSRAAGNRANGHAIDAMNYYNDAVGFHGGDCDLSSVADRANKKTEGMLPPASPLPALRGEG